MKIITLITLIFTSCICHGDYTNALPEVTVKSLDLDIKSDKTLLGIIQIPKTEKVLWKLLTDVENIDEFKNVRTDDWQAKHASLTSSLIKKAKARNLNYTSLSKCIAGIYDSTNRVASLPIAAYSVRYKNTPAWVVSYVWEYSTIKLHDGTEETCSLGHIKAYLFDEKTGDEISMVTCE